jgi:hypothetical protein
VPRLTKATLQKHLNQMEKEELVDQILTLFTKFKGVNEHFQMEFGESTKAVVDAYKAKVRKVFFGPRVRFPRLSAAKKIISEFRKVALFEYDMVDLILSRVENSIEFVNGRNYPYENFYRSIESSFAEGLKLIVSGSLEREFKERCEKIVWYAGHNKHFNLHQNIWRMYQDAFGPADKPGSGIPGVTRNHN